MSGTSDWLKHPTWRQAVRYWQGELARHPLACARCGGPIDRGPRRGPQSLDVGHIVARRQAKAMGWTVEQANAIGNTQPEHSRCSRADGARMTNDQRSSMRPRAFEASEW